ncbi:MAG: hypothetical protein ACOYI4_01770 [Christensenellales bacterium]|jgi:hypothetical protein
MKPVWKKTLWAFRILLLMAFLTVGIPLSLFYYGMRMVPPQTITVYAVGEEGTALLSGVLDLPPTCEIERAVYVPPGWPDYDGPVVFRVFIALPLESAPAFLAGYPKESGEESVRAELAEQTGEKSRITLRYAAEEDNENLGALVRWAREQGVDNQVWFSVIYGVFAVLVIVVVVFPYGWLAAKIRAKNRRFQGRG